MTAEYWIQKKTLGGWSHVTSYQDLEQAKRNYNNCVGNGMSGYSWRLVEVNELEVSMLNDVVEVDKLVEVDPPICFKEPIVKKPAWGSVVQDAPKSSAIPPARAWGDFKAPINPSAIAAPSEGEPQPNKFVNLKTSAQGFHGLAGSVWVIHHQLRQKSRVPSSELDSYLNKGYVRGGPRTQFE